MSDSPLRVLVVDDSAYNRRALGDILGSMSDVEVCGDASDGDEALLLADRLRPDLITLDLEMPRLDGFTFLRLLMARRPTPVIVVSGYSAKENVFRALELGALDFVAKPTRAVTSDLSTIQSELYEKVSLVRHLSPAGFHVQRSGTVASGRTATQLFKTHRAASEPVAVQPRDPSSVVVIGASTGGPTALLEVFSRLPPRLPATVVVAQHMPSRFTRTFAERLDRLGSARVSEAEDSHRLYAEQAWVCPGGNCVELSNGEGGPTIAVVSPGPQDRYVPSVDRLFESAAAACGDRVIGVVLTGMGDDGAAGVAAIRKAGGTVLAEAPESAVIYGMPGAAVRTGCVDQSLPLRDLADRIADLVDRPR